MTDLHTVVFSVAIAALAAGASAAPLAAQHHGARLHASRAAAAAPAAALTFSRVTLATGVTLNVAEAGDPNGEPVLFLHGYSDSWFSWSLVAERLPGGVRAIMPDQRGHGRSDRPACCYTPDAMAADAIALLDRLGIQQATVVGHSLGSFVAQRVAVAAPSRVTRLVLVGSAETLAAPGVIELASAIQSLGDTIPAAFIRDFQVSTINGALPAGFLDRVLEESALMPAFAWKAIAATFAVDTVAIASRIPVPTLVIAGELDAPFPPVLAERLRAAIPGSRYLLYGKTGHAIHWEQPDRFVSDLVKFMRP